MRGALATTMLSTVGLSLAAGGALGAVLGAWQLLGWGLGGGVPVVAEVWRHSGLTGDFFVAFFAWLPIVLGAGVLFHALVAWLGLGLVLRRPWARPAALGLAALLIGLPALAWVTARAALEDLARGFPERAAFAHEAEFLATAVALLSIAIGMALALLLVQPAVRAEFSSGS